MLRTRSAQLPSSRCPHAADDHEHERDRDDDHPRGWSRKGASDTAAAAGSVSGSITEDSVGTAAGANATAASAAVKPVVKRPTPAVVSKGAMPFSSWMSDVMPNDAWLMMSFVVAWFCGEHLVGRGWAMLHATLAPLSHDAGRLGHAVQLPASGCHRHILCIWVSHRPPSLPCLQHPACCCCCGPLCLMER
jgi:hypothetical protein